MKMAAFRKGQKPEIEVYTHGVKLTLFDKDRSARSMTITDDNFGDYFEAALSFQKDDDDDFNNLPHPGY